MLLTKENLSKIPKKDLKETLIKEYIKCCMDGVYCIENYFTVEVKGGLRIPFKLFPHQLEAFNSYENYNTCISMKSRRMGFTTFTAGYIGYKMITKNNFKVQIISKTANDSKKFVGEVKDVLNAIIRDYPWLCKGYDPSENNKMSFKLLNGSRCEGNAASEDAVRGKTIDFLACDEIAFIDRRTPTKMQEIWTAAGPALSTVNGHAVMISTPKGSSGFYYDAYTNADKMGFRIIHAHWSVHPIFKQGMYKWIPDLTKPNGGTLEFLDQSWPEEIDDIATGMRKKISKEEYKFIYDGKLRSPWYDIESTKLGPQRTKCELDCSFMGTGGEVLDSEMLRDLKMYADKVKFTNPYEHLKGVFKNYKEFEKYNSNNKYALISDVATGDGSDYSTLCVLDLTNFKIVATYKGQFIPKAFSKLLLQIGRDYGNAIIVVENQGGGETVLQCLKEEGYNNLYYSTLQKKDPSTGMKKRKLGLWASEDVRQQGGDKFEEFLRMNFLVIPCTTAVEELFNWIWDKDGKRRHAPGKNDDLIMAIQHACWYYTYVHKRGEKIKTNFRNIFELQKNGMSLAINKDAKGGFAKHETNRTKKEVNTKFIKPSSEKRRIFI